MKAKHFVAKSFAITKNKTLEIQITQWSNIFQIGLNLGWTRKCDHAGIRFNIEILGFYVGIEFTDNRHWDYTTNTFEEESGISLSDRETEQ